MSATPVARPFRVFAMMVGAGVLMSLMVVFARLAAETHAIIEVTFFRNFIGAICLGALIAAQPAGFKILKTSRPFDHLLRGIAGIVGLALNFWAATLLPLADAAALFFAMPLMVTVLAIPFLKEHVDWRRWSSVIIGFVGILVIAQPTGQVSLFGIGVALAGAFGTACSVIMVRHLGSSEPETRTVFYFFMFGAIISAVFLPWYWTQPTIESFVYLCATGVAGAGGQILITKSYAEAPAGYISSFNYLAIVYSSFFGWLLWNEWPSLAVFIGAGIVIGAGLVNYALEKTRTRKAETEVEVTYG